ncbi:MAG TPA: hypothetical protein VGX68_10995 [Thermoanaerobaculia bacterium]|jgi:hypothetical protein|nr:hypothetical protein [Thermoanaerobaculia bacterium]
MAPRKTLNADLQRLYRSPLEGFTAERNALAARLKKEGRKDDAAEVKTLAKPTPSAWAVNALFDRQPEKMEALLGAGKRARAAQREAVSGRGAEALRESIRAARVLSDELRWEAGQILAEQGRAPSRVMIERIAADLQALAFSPAAAEEAERGWLDRDLEPPGFEVLAGLQVAGAPVVDIGARLEARRQEEEKKKPPPLPKLRPLPERPAREEKREAEARRRQEAIEKARAERDAAEQARREKEAEKWRRQVAAAEEKMERARAEAGSLREEAQQAEKDAAAARRQAETAERAAERTREKAEKAAERLAEVQEELRAVRERAEAVS